MLSCIVIAAVIGVAMSAQEPPNCAWKPRATVNGMSCCLRDSIPGCRCMNPPEEIPADSGAPLCGRSGGGCPALHPLMAVGICAEMCSDHADCSSGQLCCSNGCGHVCKDPEPIVTVDNYDCPDIRCQQDLGCDGSSLKRDSNGCPMCECQSEETTTVASVDKTCVGGMVWKECGSPCTRTCSEPSPMCIEMCAPKCECPNGQVWHEKKEQCVDMAECSTSVCTGGQEWFECGMSCTATCDEPNPICNRMCAARCQCPSSKPIFHDGVCKELKDCPGVHLVPEPEPTDHCSEGCPKGQTCQQQQVQCIRAPCPMMWTCLPEPEMPCAMPMCATRCEYGYALDARGCMTCDCRSTPQSNCPVELCADSCGYTTDEYGCKKCTPCTECPMLKCVPCKYGYEMDENGCQTCDCLQTPRRHMCPMVMCANHCPFGRREMDTLKHCTGCECAGLDMYGLIGVTLGGAVLIAILVIVTVCCCRTAKKRQGKYNMIVAAMTKQPAYEKMRENSVSFKASVPKDGSEADITVKKPVSV
ncbi:zonadhesin isoform X1 [Lingula anatina]|uniref:Zonadhesin isoform X1 n=1 Tax=Lingula anatina TaxID=7574 RepID=A0A1S3I1G4_LINAN|nr:zonadhesin isoform X1 [Lingula anatina]|eukprot:XP_013391189.1 zonadhesin isoform X1 [Lingula anatina]